MRTRIIAGALSLVAAGALGALGQHAMAAHAEQQQRADFQATCRAEGGTVHDFTPQQLIGATHDGGQHLAVRFSTPVRICFK